MPLVTLTCNGYNYCKAKIMISLWVSFSWYMEKYNIAYASGVLHACVNIKLLDEFLKELKLIYYGLKMDEEIVKWQYNQSYCCVQVSLVNVLLYWWRKFIADDWLCSDEEWNRLVPFINILMCYNMKFAYIRIEHAGISTPPQCFWQWCRAMKIKRGYSRTR